MGGSGGGCRIGGKRGDKKCRLGFVLGTFKLRTGNIASLLIRLINRIFCSQITIFFAFVSSVSKLISWKIYLLKGHFSCLIFLPIGPHYIFSYPFVWLVLFFTFQQGQ